MVRKRGLGKGLSALIPENPMDEILDGVPDGASVLDLNIDLIKPNQDQPRKRFEGDALKELASSIEIYGIIQPIVVRRQGKDYEIVAGERRWRAAKVANLKTVPCIVIEADQFKAKKLALIENIQREDLNPIEEAHAFQGLVEGHQLTQEEVAEVIGKSRSYVANSLRLLNLDRETRTYIAEGKITSGHGRALLGIEDEEERRGMMDSIIEEGINVRDTERMVKDRRNRRDAKAKPRDKDPMIREIEDDLMRTLGTKVKLIAERNKGRIEIEFYDYEDLERIIETIMD